MYFIDAPSFSTARTVYLDALLTEPALDGFYGDEIIYRNQINGVLFDLLPCPFIDNPVVTEIGGSIVTLNGNLISNGGDNSAIKGFCWNTSPSPTINDYKVTSGVIGAGEYVLTAEGLTAETTYYVRAYAIIFGELLYSGDTEFITDYSTVVIGTQEWTTKNLNVSNYRNGDPIPEVTDPTAWAALTTGAWCYYNNDPLNGSTYSKLYNWYAVNDLRGLAPEGYHIPSDNEFITVFNYLGGDSVAGGSLKEAGTTHWTSPNEGATNDSGFTALPGGERAGYFVTINDMGHWWTSTEYEVYPSYSWVVYMSYILTQVLSDAMSKNNGYSVRLIKD